MPYPGPHHRPKRWIALSVLLSFALLPCTAHGQTGQNQPNKTIAPTQKEKDDLARAIAEVKQGDYAFVSEIDKAGPAHAIPILKDLFANSQDEVTKAFIAKDLFTMGVKDAVYWDFLVKRATEAIDSNPPNPSSFFSEVQGRDSRTFSPEFLAWAKAHNLAPESAVEAAIYDIPGSLLMLAMTGDPRAIPLLRRGLESPNSQIEVMAAMGLAGLRDKESIPLIVDACKRSPIAAQAIAMFGLMEFGDPQAQSAAEAYLPEAIRKDLREGKPFPASEPFPLKK